jgi:hypothetical protein
MLTSKGVRHLEVFRKLQRRHQTARATLFTDYVRDIPLVTEAQALWRGDVYIAFIGLVGLAIETLVVVLPGIPFSPTRTWRDFQVATWISAGSLVLAMVAVVMVFTMRRRVCVPWLPTDTATVVAYLYAGRMLRSFAGLSTLGGKERNDRIQLLGKKYGFGWTTGADGKTRVGVDEEELNFDYNYLS